MAGCSGEVEDGGLVFVCTYCKHVVLLCEGKTCLVWPSK